MSLGHGSKIVTDGLLFAWDAANPKSLHPVGTNSTGFNAFKDLVTGNNITSSANLYHTGKSFFNCIGITYPESSYAPASRQGITPGLGATSGTKTYDMSRDLGFFAYNEDTNTWVPDSYFNGERISGHCYDTYDGAPNQHATFQADFDAIHTAFPNATMIFIGSHAAENVDNNSATMERLKRCGMPDSQYGLGRNEFVLVGKVDRPGTWNFLRNNYSGQVAQMNIGLPLDAPLDAGVYFNGGTLSIPALHFPSGQTIEMWLKPTVTGSRRNPYNQAYGGYGTWTYEGGRNLNYYYGDGAGNASPYIGHTSNFTVEANEVACIATTRDTSISYWYKNGERRNSYSHGFGTLTSHTTGISIGYGYTGVHWIGDIYSIRLYDRALSQAEMLQNYNATRSRFGM